MRWRALRSPERDAPRWMGGAVSHELRNILVAGQAVGREQDAALLVDGTEADVGAARVEPEERTFGRLHLRVVAELDDEGPAAPDDGLPLLQPALDAPVMVARHQGMAVLGYDWYARHLLRLLSKNSCSDFTGGEPPHPRAVEFP